MEVRHEGHQQSVGQYQEGRDGVHDHSVGERAESGSGKGGEGGLELVRALDPKYVSHNREA